MVYQERTVLNAGFSSGPVTMGQIESGDAGSGRLGGNAEGMVAFARAIGLKAGDVQQITIRAPDGEVVISHADAALDSNKAQYMLFAGKKRPSSGWALGKSQATYSVMHDGRLVLEKGFELSVE
jgi:hypothetical protein